MMKSGMNNAKMMNISDFSVTGLQLEFLTSKLNPSWHLVHVVAFLHSSQFSEQSSHDVVSPSVLRNLLSLHNRQLETFPPQSEQFSIRHSSHVPDVLSPYPKLQSPARSGETISDTTVKAFTEIRSIFN